ncbi:autotransporter domain-containing protein [Rhodopseudomonas palustris]|uniref:autotransporter domain-containing protein n=1 Tax=Rhodopseudomonas palustris TaxID=1076 RepID=UPI001403DE6E|nr:autotransporter domain-containing protein [Rhodopseudomonas palustris]
MRLHSELLSGTALSSVVIVLALGLSGPALADGGTGGLGTGSFSGTGTDGPGGAGATGYSGQAGSDGQDGTGDYGGGGGGGGAAGGGAGGAGGRDGSGAASGGAGGTGGTNGATGITSVSVGVTVSGGIGGSGGAGLTSASGLGGGGGGGGGAGGYGVVETTALTLTNNGTISGGAGGNGGGTGGGLGTNGANGDGGIGVLFTAGGILENYGSIYGGSTTSAKAGTAVVGSNLTILNAGTISGGNGTSRKAIDFVSGSNVLQLLPGSFINGNVVIEAGANLTIDQRSAGVDASFGIPFTTNIAGSGTLIVDAGTHKLTLNTSAGGFTGAVNLASGTLTIASANALGSGTLALAAGTTLAFTGGNYTIANNITISGDPIFTPAAGTTQTISGVIADGGSPGFLEMLGPGTLVLSGVNTYSGGTLVTGGLINFNAANNFGTGLIALDGGGLQWATGTTTDISARLAALGSHGGSFDTNGNNVTFATGLTGSGGLTKTGAGSLVLAAVNAYTRATLINAGTLALSGAGSIAASSGVSIASGAAFEISGTNAGATITTLAGVAGATVALGSKSLTLANASTTFAGQITGTGGLTIAGGTETLTGANSYSGGTTVAAGTLALSDAGSIAASSGVSVGTGAAFDISGATAGATIATLAGSGAVALGSQTLTLANASGSFAGTLAGSGGLTLAGGRETLSGTNTYSGATTINGGTLVVNGSIANSATTVAGGATLAGTGTVGSLTVASGGTLAPGSGVAGTTLHVAGNLAFQSGALYLVQINPSTASSTISGTATLAGNVLAVFAPGSYLSKDYTILTASSRTGSFDGLTSSGLPTGFTARLDYSTPNSVTLKLQARLGDTAGFGLNLRGVANALNGYFNAGGTLPPGFVGVFGMTGLNLANALTQLSGEPATGAQQSAFQMGTAFLGLMTDPFVDGRSEGEGAGALGYAPERPPLPAGVASAYAAITKAPPRPARAYEPRWSLWGAAYGGGSRIAGDAAIGSNDLTSRAGGVAAGADYQLSPFTRLGFALAGGQSSWNLGQGLGSGRGDAFQVGVNARTTSGPAYLAASLAFANHWMSTDRMSFAATRSTASFIAQSYGGRLEAGWRIASPFVAVTPYAAVNAQWFDTPSYSETSPAGLFGLGYASRSASDTRGEAGARLDRSVALDSGSLLTLRAKLAYAHDWVSDPSLTATFQALPGASFVVAGAAPTRDSGLASVGAELRFAGGLALSAKFDGEFAAHAQTYAGTATLRYLW